jgi:hypothetical protein
MSAVNETGITVHFLQTWKFRRHTEWNIAHCFVLIFFPSFSLAVLGFELKASCLLGGLESCPASTLFPSRLLFLGTDTSFAGLGAGCCQWPATACTEVAAVRDVAGWSNADAGDLLMVKVS